MPAYTRQPHLDLAAAEQIPFDAATGLRSHELTATSSSISLAPGAYVAFLAGSIAAVMRLGATAAAPTADAAETAGAWYLPPGLCTFVIEGESNVALHGILLSAGTSLLYLMRVR